MRSQQFNLDFILCAEDIALAAIMQKFYFDNFNINDFIKMRKTDYKHAVHSAIMSNGLNIGQIFHDRCQAGDFPEDIQDTVKAVTLIVKEKFNLT